MKSCEGKTKRKGELKVLSPSLFVPSAALLALLLLSQACRKEELLQVPVTMVRIETGKLVVTTDPTHRNRLLRRRGTQLLQTSLAMALNQSQILWAKRCQLGPLRVLSLDRGILFPRPQVADLSPCATEFKEKKSIFWSSPQKKPRILRADSTDLLNWSSPETVLAPSGKAQDLDGGGLSDPTVIRFKGRWLLYYVAKPPDSSEPYQIFCAQSEDGKTWRRYPSEEKAMPVLAAPPGGSRKGRVQPSACVLGDKVFLWFGDLDAGRKGVWLATSEDGVNFKISKRVLKGFTNCTVGYLQEAKLFIMAHGEVSSGSLKLGFSADGINWRFPDPPALLSCGPPETVHHSPGFLKTEQGFIRKNTVVFYVGGIAYGETPSEPTWEIESTAVYFHLRA